MTTLAAWQDDDGSWYLAADGQATDQHRVWLGQKKIVRFKLPKVGDVLIAMAGAASTLALVRHRLQPVLESVAPALNHTTADTWAYEVTMALGALIKDTEDLKLDDDDKGQDFVGFLAWKDRCWGLEPRLAMPTCNGYDAAGTGGEVALGVLWAHARLNGTSGLDAVEIVTRAVQAGIEHTTGSGGDVTVERTKV